MCYSIAGDGIVSSRSSAKFKSLRCHQRLYHGNTSQRLHVRAHSAAVARNGQAAPEIYVDGAQQPITSHQGWGQIKLHPTNHVDRIL
jgi:hypothetical protein